MNAARRKHPHDYDILIVGGGAAGLGLALYLPETLSICLLAKGGPPRSSTYYAQGGISAVLGGNDSLQAHIDDTLAIGAGLCLPEVVDRVIRAAPRMIGWLQEVGVPFTTDSESRDLLHLAHEAGHSHRRIVHSKDRTGKAVQDSLLEKVRERKNITIADSVIAVDLITNDGACLGAYALHTEENGRSKKIAPYTAGATILATGGIGKVYLYTSNPDSASGDGIAMAWRAGCRVANMEFIQFHPTCLYHPQAKSFLLSEALRGEGARLLLPDGKEFMHRFDPRGALAPRDIAARSIDHEMKRLGIDCVYLDISRKPAEFIESSFPSIYRECLKYGYDITKTPVPVVPAVHYNCGGIVTDLNGRTDLDGLYAIGETAWTGLHGANRMAGNSLLECIAFAKFAANDIAGNIAGRSPPDIPAWDESRVIESSEEVVTSHSWNELRQVMWDYAGIVRTEKHLRRAQRRIDLLLAEVDEHYREFRISGDFIELRNLVTVANLIVRSALSRRESRGLHYMREYPHADPALDGKNTLLKPAQRGSEVGEIGFG